MPNPVPARYTVQLGPTFTPEMAAELAAWGELLSKSTSVVIRECTEDGLERLRADFIAEVMAATGLTSGEVRARYDAILPGHLEAAQRRGQTQVSRRRAYDNDRRGSVAEATGLGPTDVIVNTSSVA